MMKSRRGFKDFGPKYQELAYLEKSIGRTGMLAVAPLLSQTPRDLSEKRRLAQNRSRG